MTVTMSALSVAPDFIGAGLDHAFDYARMAGEMRACEEFFVETPPYPRHISGALSGEIPFMSESERNYRRVDTYTERGIARNELRGAKVFYLRNSHENDVTRDSRFAVTKNLSHESWYWRPELAQRIPYTISCIESLPYRTLGLVRAFLCEDTFMPTHRDTVPQNAEAGYDRGRAVGISLVPDTGGVDMLIWDDARRQVLAMKGHCLVFDDSKWHGVPMTSGLRITLRIFGELDFERLSERFTEVLAG
jgi:hypothetical protein